MMLKMNNKITGSIPIKVTQKCADKLIQTVVWDTKGGLLKGYLPCGSGFETCKF